MYTEKDIDRILKDDNITNKYEILDDIIYHHENSDKIIYILQLKDIEVPLIKLVNEMNFSKNYRCFSKKYIYNLLKDSNYNLDNVILQKCGNTYTIKLKKCNTEIIESLHQSNDDDKSKIKYLANNCLREIVKVYTEANIPIGYDRISLLEDIIYSYKLDDIKFSTFVAIYENFKLGDKKITTSIYHDVVDNTSNGDVIDFILKNFDKSDDYDMIIDDFHNNYL